MLHLTAPFSDVLAVGRWMLGLMLMTTALSKLNGEHRKRTQEAIANYRVLPRRLHQPLAAALPGIELTLAGSLLLGIGLDVGAGAAALMLGGFAIVMAWHVQRRSRFDCGCGAGHQISWWLVSRNVVLCFVALGVAVTTSPALALWPGPSQMPPATTMTAALPMPLIAIVTFVGARLLENLPLPIPRLSRAEAM